MFHIIPLTSGLTPHLEDSREEYSLVEQGVREEGVRGTTAQYKHITINTINTEQMCGYKNMAPQRARRQDQSRGIVQKLCVAFSP